MNEETKDKIITLVGGPLNGFEVGVYFHQTTATIMLRGTLETYQKCKDDQWRYVPRAPENASD